jgi:hypothetical protein
MFDSPYAPPRAIVADIEPSTESIARPHQVSRAVICMWTIWGIGLARGLWNIFQPKHALLYGPINAGAAVPPALALVYLVLGFLIWVWIYTAIAKGRNWARILYLVFAGLTAFGLAYILYMTNIGAISVIAALVSLVNSCLTFYVAYLLLTAPARAWFRYMKGRKT